MSSHFALLALLHKLPTMPDDLELETASYDDWDMPDVDDDEPFEEPAIDS